MAAAAENGETGDAEIVHRVNPGGRSDILLICEHASHRIPPEFDHLGLEPALRQDHIAWDPGAFAVAEALSNSFDAPLIAHRVSRLVYDCNRPPSASDAVAERSERFDIPGNKGLSQAARAARATRFYAPFHRAIRETLDRMENDGRRPVLMTVHSFTPVYLGKPRAVELGILHDRDSRLADALLTELDTDGGYNLAENQPYGPADGVTHTLVEHALPRGLLNVMIEIRSDLIAEETAQTAMARHIAEATRSALAELGATVEAPHA